MNACRFGVSPVNYPDPDPDATQSLPQKCKVFIFKICSVYILLVASVMSCA